MKGIRHPAFCAGNSGTVTNAIMAAAAREDRPDVLLARVDYWQIVFRHEYRASLGSGTISDAPGPARR